MNYNGVKNVLVKSLKDFLGDKKAVIGISGGIDSAVIASLCVRAVGNKNVIGIQMPYGDQSTGDGSALMKNLGIEDWVINIKHSAQCFPIMLPSIEQNAPLNRLTNGNIRARVRMTLLYAYAGANNGIVVGTGNKTELMLGYFTKYGDGGVDIEPIGGLYKTEVFELAKELGDIPDSIITKPPSAELWEGQTDEGEIGMTYAEMDDILSVLEVTDKSEYANNRYVLAKKYGNDKVFAIEKRVRESEHKRNVPKSFVIDRKKCQRVLL